MLKPSVQERFWEKVDVRGPDDCWLWTAGVIKNTGCGQFRHGETNVAHRVAFHLETGSPVPRGVYIWQTCENIKCCNPAHLIEADSPRGQCVALGEVYGRLTVLAFIDERTSFGCRQVLCRCECGATRTVPGRSLTSGNTQSCGCKRRRHGHAGERCGPENPQGRPTRTYTTWKAMVNRCTNPNATGYEYYGGRGIAICDRWRTSFASFLEDMGERPENRTIDRVDVDGDYEPANCRWATPKEQIENRRPK